MNKKKLCVLIATAVSMPVYASDGDLYNFATNAKEVSTTDYATNAAKLTKVINDLLFQGNNYGLEYKSKVYKGNDITKYTKNMDNIDDKSMQPLVFNPLVTPLDATSLTGTTLSKITLDRLYCTNNANAVLTAGDTTDSFYIDYTATDSSGNATNNYDLIKSGLMDKDGTITGIGLVSTPNFVTVSLVKDPSNSNNALIKVTPPEDSNNILFDQQIVVTAFIRNGKSASTTLTLKEGSVLDKVTLMAPSTTVYAGDTGVIIPFTAVDQNGKTLTKYSDIKDAVAFNSSFSADVLQLIQNPDGTASLQLNVPDTAVQAPLTSQSYTIDAVSLISGKYSRLNIEVQAKAVPNK